MRRGLAGGLLVRGAAGVPLMPVLRAQGQISSQLTGESTWRCSRKGTCDEVPAPHTREVVAARQVAGAGSRVGCDDTAHGHTSGFCQWPLTSVPAQDRRLQHAFWRTH